MSKQAANTMTEREAQRSLMCENLSFAASESYKLLRTNLTFKLSHIKKCPVIGVTSCMRGEGKTTTSINLAYTFAETGKRILLIDGDMRLPNVARSLLIERKPGLSDYIANISGLESCLRRSDLIANWEILPAGNIPPNPSEILSSDDMRMFIEQQRENYDYIIVDLPPIGIVSDAMVAAGNFMDGIIMVVREDYSSKRLLSKCVAQMDPLKDKLLGFVMTDTSKNNKGYYYSSHSKYKKYSKQYGYGSGYGKKSAYGYGYGYGYSGAGKKARTDASMTASQAAANAEQKAQEREKAEAEASTGRSRKKS